MTISRGTDKPAYTARTKRKQNTRLRILDTAADIFYKNGFANVAMNQIADVCGISKPTLYAHFPNKDALVGECLNAVDDRHFQWFVDQTERLIRTGETPALAVFDVLAKWFNNASFRGCTFINASIELNGAIAAAQVAVLRHKTKTRSWLANLCARSGIVRDACDSIAAQLMILMEGAIVTALVEERTEAAQESKRVAELVLETSRCCSSASEHL